MHDLSTLRGEQDQDREQQADQRPRAEPLQKLLVVPLRPDQVAQREACDDRRAEWDPQEHTDALGCYVILQPRDVPLTAEDLDEEDGDWREENHLQHGIDGHKDRAVFSVSAGQTCPDEDLDGSVERFLLSTY